jgi:hypothetical protein
MPSREQTIADAIEVFTNALYPSGLIGASAWLGIYQVLLWYEPVNCVGFDCLPHLIDADRLRPSSLGKKKADWIKPTAWQKRANMLAAYLAGQLGCSPEAVPLKTDLLMKRHDYQGMQRQNTLGIAFVGLVRHVLGSFGAPGVSYETEVEATKIFPGITFPGRSNAPRIDILATRKDAPRAIVSAKWSVRHDRLNDITNECPVYKAAYERIYRRSHREPLQYFVITNEFSAARLNKMLDDTCVDGVVHVHKAAVVDICGLDSRLTRLIDLADFVDSTYQW